MATPRTSHAHAPQELQALLAAEGGTLPFLWLRDGEGRLTLVVLDPDRPQVSVGRSADADVSLAWDDRASRLHLVFEHVAGEWTVADDGLSTNGTFVDGERLHGRRRLRDHDVVLAGRTALTFRVPGRAVAVVATTPAVDGEHRTVVTEAQRRVLVELCRPVLLGGAFATPATNRQIAEALYLSVEAVKTHLRTLYARHEIEGLPQNQKRMALVERATRSGSVTRRDVEP